MYKLTRVPKDAEQWLINLIELKNRSGKTTKEIAEEENLAEKSVSNVFLGTVKNPGVDLVRKIIHSLGGHWNEIFDESGAVIGGEDLVSLQAEIDRLTGENALLASRLDIANIDLTVQKEKVCALEYENKILTIRLEYEQKLVAVYDFYNKLASTSSD